MKYWNSDTQPLEPGAMLGETGEVRFAFSWMLTYLRFLSGLCRLIADTTEAYVSLSSAGGANCAPFGPCGPRDAHAASRACAFGCAGGGVRLGKLGSEWGMSCKPMPSSCTLRSERTFCKVMLTRASPTVAYRCLSGSFVLVCGQSQLGWQHWMRVGFVCVFAPSLMLSVAFDSLVSFPARQPLFFFFFFFSVGTSFLAPLLVSFARVGGGGEPTRVPAGDCLSAVQFEVTVNTFSALEVSVIFTSVLAVLCQVEVRP